jgi:hypothetical protein
MSIQGRAVAVAVVGALAVIAASVACASDYKPARTATPPGTVTQPETVTLPAAVAGWWSTDLGAVPLGTAAGKTPTATALARQWSHYGQGEEDEYGNPVVVSARGAGLPEPPIGGDHTIRLSHPRGNPATEHKLYKSFSARSWPAGTEPFSPNAGSPANVSGRYIVYEYVSAAQLRLGIRGWVNLAQLKEGYATDDGDHTSDPSWWLVAYDRNGRLFLDLAHWAEGSIAGPRLDLGPLLDRWLKIEMRVYQGDRVEVYLNDKLFDVGRQAQYPVGRMLHVGGRVPVTGATVTHEEGWIFGAGNYSNPSDPGSGSLVHVGLATVLPLP